jgi:vacuolar protein sorting-associated protein VTA1
MGFEGVAGSNVAGEYWAVNQILAKQLHLTNEGILNYTTNLMDKLEQVRTDAGLKAPCVAL